MSQTNLPAVNLLKDRKRRIRRQQVIFAKVQLMAGVILAIYIAILGILLSVRLLVSRNLASVEDSISDEKLTLSQLKPVESLYTVVVNKASLLADYLEARAEQRNNLVNLYEKLPEEVLITKVTYEDQDRTYETDLITQDMYSVLDLLNMMEASIEDKSYRVIQIDGLGRDKDGTYIVPAIFQLGTNTGENGTI